MTAISVIMPCYNRAYDLHRVLEAYDQQIGDVPFEVIAIDDASSDGTNQLLSGYQAQRYRLTVLQQDRNQGPAAARNRGIEKASNELILFVGDDILPQNDFIQRHLIAHRSKPQTEVAILGRSLWPPDAPVNTLMAHIDGVGAQQFSYHFLQHGRSYDFRHFYTSNISLKTEFLKSEKNWFDTSFPYAAFEDVELSYRLAKRGMQIIYDQSPLAYHYHYHNIWTFSKRQRNAGEMIERIVRKYPEIRRLTVFRTAYRHVWKLEQGSLRARRLTEDAIKCIEQLACYLISSFEWQQNPLLDGLYRQTLGYFVYDGLIHALFDQDPKQIYIRSEHILKSLIPSLQRFIDDATRCKIKLPAGYHDMMLNNFLFDVRKG